MVYTPSLLSTFLLRAVPNGIVTAKPCSKSLTREIYGVKILFFLIGAHSTLVLECETEINSYVTYVNRTAVLSNIHYNMHVQILKRSDKPIKILSEWLAK